MNFPPPHYSTDDEVVSIPRRRAANHRADAHADAVARAKRKLRRTAAGHGHGGHRHAKSKPPPPPITVQPPSPSLSSSSSGISFARPRIRDDVESSPARRHRSKVRVKHYHHEHKSFKRSSSWSCGSDCGSDHDDGQTSKHHHHHHHHRVSRKARDLGRRRKSTSSLVRAVAAEETELRRAGSAGTTTGRDSGLASSSANSNSAASAANSAGGGASASEEGTLLAGSRSVGAGLAAVTLGGERVEMSKDIVSLLILDGCKECEARMGVTEDDYYLGKRENYPLHVFATGEKRLRAQCDPSNWTYGRAPESSSSGSSTGDSRRGSRLLASRSSAALMRAIPPLPPFAPQPPDEQLAKQVRGDGVLHNSHADETSVLPRYLQNIIHHHTHISKPQHDARLLKKLSKHILLPEDPSDPAAFTVTPGLTRRPNKPWCSSKPVLKIVTTFALLMTLLIIAATVYMIWFSDTFRPMHM